MDEEQARLEAEARRQRILESAAKRMDRVNGLFSGEDAPADDDEEETDTAGTAAAPPAKKTSSKLAAMRRRRFKKASGTTAEASTTTTTTGTETEEATAADTKVTTTTETPVAETATTSPSMETKATTESDPVTPEAVATTNQPESTTTPAAAEAAAGTTTSATETKTSTGTAGKKYMGVARMRRKMVKEKQQKADEEPEAESTLPVIPKKFSKVAPPKPTWPILMHFLTILFLFLTGLEVGLQQHVIEYTEDLTIHQTLAPQQELRLLNPGFPFSSSSLSPSPQIVKPVGVGGEEIPMDYGKDDADEFAKGDVGVEQQQENLDPLFGVDLDALTAGPGVVNFAGRLAVRGHRAILWFFFYLPLSIWRTLLGLVASPPVLCLASLAIRQGNLMLGGKLPEAVGDDAKTSTQSQDIMTTIRNLVTGFILRSFPTATKLYEAWTHLRSDMYVVMCGLFVGLVWHHYLSAIVASTPTDGEQANSQEL